MQSVLVPGLFTSGGGSGGSSGASTALDNLASVAINTSLISDTDNTDDLGSAAKKWRNVYVGTQVIGAAGSAALPVFSVTSGGLAGGMFSVSGFLCFAINTLEVAYFHYNDAPGFTFNLSQPTGGFGICATAAGKNPDTTWYRRGAGVWSPGGSVVGTAADVQAAKSLLTVGTMTQTSTVQALLRRSVSKFSWTNAMVAALGAVTTGDIAVCTLPAKFVVTNAFVVITGAGGTVTTLTVSLGRTGAAYIDYVVASDAKAAANTVYGDADAERGANMSPTKAVDVPSYTGTTVVNAQFISTGGNLSTVTGSTGDIFIEGYLLP